MAAPAAMAAGAAMLSLAVLVACGAGPAPDEGADAVEELSASPSAVSTVSPAPTSAGTPTKPEPAIAPVALKIPAIAVDASVNPTGVDARTGDFAVPPSVDEVGWYKFGPGLEATEGSIVIAGHVDSREQGKGAFFRLGTLSRGDRLTVTGSDGTERQYKVVARQEYQKTKIPLEKYFARDGQLRLTLITCGGPFDRRTRHYRDNIVVTAVAPHEAGDLLPGSR
jgi:LPXTG-site transpeptidase (sortase) family protein